MRFRHICELEAQRAIHGEISGKIRGEITARSTLDRHRIELGLPTIVDVTTVDHVTPLPAGETERLQRLYDLDVLDTEAEQTFDDLVELAAAICGVPTALISFVDKDRQWFKARHGIDVTETPRSMAFCAHTIMGEQTFVVPDATADPRFASNPLVEGDPNIRFYAGVPLRPHGGSGVGSLCVIDSTARELDSTALAALRLIGNQVERLLEARLLARSHADIVGLAERLDIRYQTVTDSMAHGVIVHDLSGRIEAANPAAERMLGLTFDQLYGLSPTDAAWRCVREDGSPFPGEEQPAAITLRTGREVRDVVIGVRTGDDLRWIQVCSTLLTRTSGQPEGVVATFVDVTAERRLRANTERALDLLTRTVQEHATLTSSVTHDLAAPVAASRIYADLLAEMDFDGPVDGSALRALVAKLRTNAHRTEGLVADLGAVSRRIGVASPAPTRTSTDLGTIVRRTAAMCARTVHVDVNATDVTAEVDPVQIERIVDNLLSNADKYTPPESLIHVIVDGDDDTVRISVIDDGPGIAECDLERVFEPFDRSSVTPGQPGSGVGLFLVRQFAAFHGGDARCERLDGGGTRFVVTLARRSPAVLKG